MAVINIYGMDKYKTYYTERVKGKDGITRPITKCRYVKTCPQCGGEMTVINHQKASIRKPRTVKWWCDDRICGHSEQEESSTEKIRRINNA